MNYEEEPLRGPGPKATFEVKVESFDTSSFYEDVVRAAADRIVGSRYPENAIVKAIHQAAAETIEKRIDAAIASTIDKLLSDPIQKFDTFGKPVGEAMSVEEIVRAGADRLLTETVDREGRSAKNGYGTTYKTRLEWLVENAVLNNLAKDMKAEADKVRTALVQRASAAAAAVLAGVK